MRELLLGTACLGLLAGPTSAQSIQFGGGSRFYTVAPGQTVKVGQHYSIRNCKGTGVPKVNVYADPSLGSVEHSIVQTRVDDGVRNARGQSLDAFDDCAGQPVEAVEVRYTAGPTPGRDHFSYQLVWGNGNASRAEIQIRVR